MTYNQSAEEFKKLDFAYATSKDYIQKITHEHFGDKEVEVFGIYT